MWYRSWLRRPSSLGMHADAGEDTRPRFLIGNSRSSLSSLKYGPPSDVAVWTSVPSTGNPRSPPMDADQVKSRPYKSRQLGENHLSHWHSELQLQLTYPNH
ncbi:hypothetical protein AFLA_002807 [Aspergillus flavus NRRL3357]|nr:hypothetical protein AFLA_002807 [Aspergillus flavus NRRL3357]